ncbi:MAG TPA: hypothetical protein VGB82_16215 [Alphaproteobacteria bacterium]
MVASRLVIIALGLSMLAGCTFPLTTEIKQECAASTDPTACAKAKYAAEFAEERERIVQSGGGN